jgi:hypothetical protein
MNSALSKTRMSQLQAVNDSKTTWPVFTWFPGRQLYYIAMLSRCQIVMYLFWKRSTNCMPSFESEAVNPWGKLETEVRRLLDRKDTCWHTQDSQFFIVSFSVLRNFDKDLEVERLPNKLVNFYRYTLRSQNVRTSSGSNCLSIVFCGFTTIMY